ncbi:hypothetical protein ACFE04_008015 [Oxalis oulophora]
MVSLEAAPPSRSIDTSPRISFSAEFLDEDDFISINPHPHPLVLQPPPITTAATTTTTTRETQESSSNSKQKEKEKHRNVDFEFLSNVSSHSLLTADELFFEGKLLPFWQMQQSDKLQKISLNPKDEITQVNSINTRNSTISSHKETPAMNWFIDDDPSPRPPKCTVLWKELLKLKKQRASSSLSPSSSSSSNSSSSSSLADAAANVEEGNKNSNSHVKRIKKGLERTRSASIRIRPMINLPICSTTQQVKSSTTNSLPPLFPIKKQGRFK